jgi:hypothetical protein
MTVGMDEQPVPPVGIDADAAFVLEPQVPYVPGWAQAQRALEALLVELAACGLDGRLAYARAEVTVAGVGVVELGRVTPGTARALARLLAAARLSRPEEGRGSPGTLPRGRLP